MVLFVDDGRLVPDTPEPQSARPAPFYRPPDLYAPIQRPRTVCQVRGMHWLSGDVRSPKSTSAVVTPRHSPRATSSRGAVPPLFSSPVPSPRTRGQQAMAHRVTPRRTLPTVPRTHNLAPEGHSLHHGSACVSSLVAAGDWNVALRLFANDPMGRAPQSAVTTPRARRLRVLPMPVNMRAAANGSTLQQHDNEEVVCRGSSVAAFPSQRNMPWDEGDNALPSSSPLEQDESVVNWSGYPRKEMLPNTPASRCASPATTHS
jgi:hypothetical protein